MSDYEKKLARKKKQLERVQRELHELLGQCTHEYGTYVRSEYDSGSYLNRAYTIKEKVCHACHRVVESKQIDHNWYG